MPTAPVSYVFRTKLMFDKRTYRDILICGDQTFEQLHEAIFAAFDRDDEHLYRFTVRKTVPGMADLQKALRRFGFPAVRSRADNSCEMLIIACPECCDEPDSWADEQFNAAKTKIRELGFSVKQKFEYLFDFGDEWNHEIEVMDILPVAQQRKYPSVIKAHGESPAQYDDLDEE